LGRSFMFSKLTLKVQALLEYLSLNKKCLTSLHHIYHPRPMVPLSSSSSSSSSPFFKFFFLFYSEIYSFDEYLMCYLDQILCMFHERIIKIDKRKSCCHEISTSNNIWFHSWNYRMRKYFGSLFSSSKTGIKRSASC